jgi:hypothetical protein
VLAGAGAMVRGFKVCADRMSVVRGFEVVGCAESKVTKVASVVGLRGPQLCGLIASTAPSAVTAATTIAVTAAMTAVTAAFTRPERTVVWGGAE